MKSVFKPLLIALGITLLPSALVLAHAAPEDKPGHCGKPPEHRAFPEAGMMPGAPLPPFLHGADLSETQRDAVFAILHADAPAVWEHMKAERKAQEALHQLTFSGKYDEAKAKELVNTAADHMAALSLLRVRSESRIYALLTPEQRKQASEMKEKFGPHPAGLHVVKPQAREARAI